MNRSAADWRKSSPTCSPPRLEVKPRWPLVVAHVVVRRPRAFRNDIPEHGPAEFPTDDMYRARTSWVPSSGALSSAKNSSSEKGHLLVADVVDGIATAARHEFRLDSHVPVTSLQRQVVD